MRRVVAWEPPAAVAPSPAIAGLAAASADGSTASSARFGVTVRVA
jgi:hypothetical protein